MKRTVAAAVVAAVTSSAIAAPAAPLRQGCGKQQDVIARLKGYIRESRTRLDIGIVKEKWTNKDDRVDVTLMPDGSACAWRELSPYAPRFYRYPTRRP